MKMNIDSCILYLNSKVVLDILKANKAKYLKITEQFPVYLYLQIPENPYLHALVFTSEEDRNEAYNLLKYNKEILNVHRQFYYKGEYITTEMMKALLNANGNFMIWEGIEDKDEHLHFNVRSEFKDSSIDYRMGYAKGSYAGAEDLLNYLVSKGYLTDSDDIRSLHSDIYNSYRKICMSR